MKENRNLEFKETVSNTFLKTVSAFANYGGGQIIFGVRDDGSIAGVDAADRVCLDIENRINDSIEPIPQYTMGVNGRTAVITLTVEEGLHKPYLYKAKAYRRNDTSTIEVDHLELTRLILEGKSLSYEELPARTKNLSFRVLEKKLKSMLHLQDVTTDTLKTLELCTEDSEINIAGELLADKNGFCGIDIVRFGENISILLDREIFEKQSVLLQYEGAVEMYKKYYQYEEVKGVMARESVSMIPEEAFREAVANALVHRTWDVDANINIGMYPDRIEITSPGGLPQGMTPEEYFRGGISVLRNRILGTVFFRLKMIERFGTGIRRIIEAYKDSEKKPAFDIKENSIQMVLPVIDSGSELTEDENKVYKMLRGRALASSTIVEYTGFGKTKTVGILNKLVKAGYIRSHGNGRGTKYSLK